MQRSTEKKWEILGGFERKESRRERKRITEGRKTFESTEQEDNNTGQDREETYSNQDHRKFENPPKKHFSTL